MRLFITMLSLLTVSSLVQAQMCGENSPQVYRGNAEAAKLARSTNLVCKTKDGFSEAKVNEFGVTRCVNSETYLSLKLFGVQKVIQDIQQNGDGSFLIRTSLTTQISVLPLDEFDTKQVFESMTCVDEKNKWSRS